MSVLWLRRTTETAETMAYAVQLDRSAASSSLLPGITTCQSTGPAYSSNTCDDQQSPKIYLKESQSISKNSQTSQRISSSTQLSQIWGSQISKNRSLSHGSVAPLCPTASLKVEAATAALAPNGQRRIYYSWLTRCAVHGRLAAQPVQDSMVRSAGRGWQVRVRVDHSRRILEVLSSS